MATETVCQSVTVSTALAGCSATAHWQYHYDVYALSVLASDPVPDRPRIAHIPTFVDCAATRGAGASHQKHENPDLAHTYAAYPGQYFYLELLRTHQ